MAPFDGVEICESLEAVAKIKDLGELARGIHGGRHQSPGHRPRSRRVREPMRCARCLPAGFKLHPAPQVMLNKGPIG